MKHHCVRVAATTCSSLLMALSLSASAQDVVMPDETVLWIKSPLPGYQKVMQQCMTCHSAHYAQYQPGTTPRAYWEAQVKRMKTVFNAPIPDADVELITEYLFKTYSKDPPGSTPKPGVR